MSARRVWKVLAERLGGNLALLGALTFVTILGLFAVLGGLLEAVAYVVGCTGWNLALWPHLQRQTRGGADA